MPSLLYPSVISFAAIYGRLEAIYPNCELIGFNFWQFSTVPFSRTKLYILGGHSCSKRKIRYHSISNMRCNRLTEAI